MQQNLLGIHSTSLKDFLKTWQPCFFCVGFFLFCWGLSAWNCHSLILRVDVEIWFAANRLCLPASWQTGLSQSVSMGSCCPGETPRASLWRACQTFDLIERVFLYMFGMQNCVGHHCAASWFEKVQNCTARIKNKLFFFNTFPPTCFFWIDLPRHRRSFCLAYTSHSFLKEAPCLSATLVHPRTGETKRSRGGAKHSTQRKWLIANSEEGENSL